MNDEMILAIIWFGCGFITFLGSIFLSKTDITLGDFIAGFIVVTLFGFFSLFIGLLTILEKYSNVVIIKKQKR